MKHPYINLQFKCRSCFTRFVVERRLHGEPFDDAGKSMMKRFCFTVERPWRELGHERASRTPICSGYKLKKNKNCQHLTLSLWDIPKLTSRLCKLQLGLDPWCLARLTNLEFPTESAWLWLLDASLFPRPIMKDKPFQMDKHLDGTAAVRICTSEGLSDNRPWRSFADCTSLLPTEFLSFQG